jgi:predicted ATPase
MSAAHGGQVLLSQPAAALIADRLPAGVTLRDLGAVRLRDLAIPEHVYQMMHPNLRQEFPALRSLDVIPNNLPQQLTSFIGRERELAEVKKLLRRSRLLTLVGMGGIGKTRLSLQVATEVMNDFPDGVWFVDLSPLREAWLVPQAVASVLGVKEDAGLSVTEALVNYVKDRQFLLILDNCEHLLQGSAELAKALLEAGSQLKVLASSRERLHMTAEATYPLPTLAVPDLTFRVTPDTLVECEGGRLFVERAIAVQPSFNVTPENAVAVAQVCHRLEGIPLALELAAARVRAMSVEEVAGHLDDRFRLLTGGDRTALPRQQTLHAMIDWSYDLLEETERLLLRRLAVFSGGWTIDAAVAIGAGEGLDQADVLDLLTRLVEKTLVIFDADSGRYRMLETVRLYAQERLLDFHDGDLARKRHLDFYLALAEMAEPKSHVTAETRWFERLASEVENLLAAHGWCDSARAGAEVGLRLAGALTFFFDDRAHLRLGRAVLEHALARPGAEEETSARVKALSGAGKLAYSQGDYVEARKRFTGEPSDCFELWRAYRRSRRNDHLGNIAAAEGDFEQAHTNLHQAIELAEQSRVSFPRKFVFQEVGCNLD